MRFVENFVYLSLRLVGAFISAIPFPLKRAGAGALAWFWFHFVRFRRNIILHNAAAVFPREPEESMGAFQARCEKLAIANMQHVTLSFLEILERFHWTPETFRRRVKAVGAENVWNALEKGQGFFFLTAHMGNWELITLTGVMLGFPLSIVTKRLRNGFFDRIWVRSRLEFGLELLEESGSGLGIVKAIRSRRAVGFILDQHTGEPHGIESNFLGLKAWCPKGLAILSTRLKCPVIPAYLLRQNDGSFRVEIGAPLEFPYLGDRTRGLRTESGNLTEEGIRYHVQVCNENMQRMILRAPDQYLWMHRRFKNILDYRAPLPWQL